MGAPALQTPGQIIAKEVSVIDAKRVGPKRVLNILASNHDPGSTVDEVKIANTLAFP